MPTPQVLLNTRLFTGGADLTSQSNKLVLAAEKDEKDVTTFLPETDPDSGWKKVTGGIGSAAASASGFWEAGDLSKVDDVSWADLGGLSAWTMCPTSGAVGSVAYVMKALRGNYHLFDAVGEVAPWSAEAKSAWPLARGAMVHPNGTARTASGNGTAVQISAVTSTQNLYAALHVFSVAGTSTPTITATVQSYVDGTFSAPTTQISFVAATAIGGQILRVAGPITDTFYRVSWTITGTSPSFLFACSVGVGN